MNVTELAKELKKYDIYLPLPWVDYTGPFCCTSCISYDIKYDNLDEGYKGSIFACQQRLGHTLNSTGAVVYFSWGPSYGDEDDFNSYLHSVLKKLDVPHVKPENASTTYQITLDFDENFKTWDDQEQEMRRYDDESYYYDYEY